ncbi:MAG: histidinol dehydrogenase [Bacteroidota bacterium]
MNIIINPPKFAWPSILQRPAFDTVSLQKTVREILDDVKENGDHAIVELTQQYDKVLLKDFEFDEVELMNAEADTPSALKKAIIQAAENIEKFHASQITLPEIIETIPGVQCWRKSVGIEKVGIYIPGGTAPLFSTVLMLGIPAKLAGCKQIVLCSPPNVEGKLHPAIIYAAKLVGVTHIYKIGGVQAIAAMAYGTRTVPKVNKIFGPGNRYVTCAKQLVQEDGIAIDMPAGPSEVCVYADDSAHAYFVAADLLSQAEHGADSQVLLVSSSEVFVNKVNLELEKQLELLSRKDIAAKALQNSKAIIVEDLKDAIDIINEYAPEHLILACNDPMSVGNKIINAGSIFLGNYSPESAGDYASGTNHTLPTNGYAKAYSGISVDSFVKKITFQKLSKQGLLNIANTVELMAEAEGLDAHKNAITIRVNHLKK